jgi:hypothetical protein
VQIFALPAHASLYHASQYSAQLRRTEVSLRNHKKIGTCCSVKLK